MRRRLVVVVAAIAGSTFGARIAQAQSSVELYGSVDGGIGYLHNVAAPDGSPVSNQVRFTNGLLHGNRWGFRGSEDLGGGLKAIFLLENGFDLGTGNLNQGGREFGRQAFTGLTDKTLGSLLLGRQYDPNVDLILPLTADAVYGKSFGTPGDIDNYDDTPTKRCMVLEALPETRARVKRTALALRMRGDLIPQRRPTITLAAAIR
jgi:predicted porin